MAPKFVWHRRNFRPQTLRILFDAPQRITKIRVAFEELEANRTQEFVLRWGSDRGEANHEILRQQYTFSPPQCTQEVETYGVELDQVSVLEITIVPDISHNQTMQ